MLKKINYTSTSGKDHGSLWKPNKYYSSSMKWTYNKQLKIYLQLSNNEREQSDAMNLKRWWKMEKKVKFRDYVIASNLLPMLPCLKIWWLRNTVRI